MKRNPLTLVIGVLLLIVFGLLLFVFQVRQSRSGCRHHLWQADARYHQAGPYFKWPWPIQRVYNFDQRVQNFGGQVHRRPTQRTTSTC